MLALMFTREDLKVKRLGTRKVLSPLNLSTVAGDWVVDYIPDEAGVLYQIEVRDGEEPDTTLRFEKAGPRERIFFDSVTTKAGIVTCGGICPGINNVIRSMVFELYYKYGIKKIIGFRYGYQGLNPAQGVDPVPITPAEVSHVHRQGGTFLGLGRGAQDPKVMVDTLVRHGIDILFTIGGDGTLRGTHAIAEELERRGLPISVIGVPKTIDNDVEFVDKTFGFDTAVEVARLALDAAHTEAIGTRNGIGLVKVMGRDTGFIAAAATLASMEVNYCLVPEIPFELEGPRGFLAALEKRLRDRGHALIVVAEGCGMHLVDTETERDASGNVRYNSANVDIGPRLREEIRAHFKAKNLPTTIKYIDPSYMIRSGPANANDSIFCDMLARQAVHAGMAGMTDMVIGRWAGIFTHVPLSLVTKQRKRIDPRGPLWLAVTETTGQAYYSSQPSALRPSEAALRAGDKLA